MGFNSLTLLSLIFGLIVPVAIFIIFILSKHRKELALGSVGYGFLSFLASIVAVFVVFVISNSTFLASLTFENETDGLLSMGIVICVMVAILYLVCESLKMWALKKFTADENKFRFAGLGFSAGVILAQNVVVFIALNIFSNYEMEPAYALFSGAIVCVTGIMYTVISHSCDIIIKSGTEAPAYAISAVYYLFWVSAIIFSRSTIMLYISLAFFFVLSFALSGAFIFKIKKSAGGKK